MTASVRDIGPFSSVQRNGEKDKRMKTAEMEELGGENEEGMAKREK